MIWRMFKNPVFLIGLMALLLLVACATNASGGPLTLIAAEFVPGVDSLPIAGAVDSNGGEARSETRWATFVFIVRLRNDDQRVRRVHAEDRNRSGDRLAYAHLLTRRK